MKLVGRDEGSPYLEAVHLRVVHGVGVRVREVGHGERGGGGAGGEQVTTHARRPSARGQGRLQRGAGRACGPGHRERQRRREKDGLDKGDEE